MTTLLLGLGPHHNVPTEQIDRLRKLADGMNVVITEDRAAMQAALDDAEIIAGYVQLDVALAAPRLRWYQQWGAGADWLLHHPEVAARDFVLTNTSGIHAIQISEHILALMLAFARRLPQAQRAQERRQWLHDSDQLEIFELAGRTLLLVGVGAIGRRTARLAEALEMRVWGVRRNAGRPEPGIERIVGSDQLHAVLPQADFVALTVPLTAETRGMIGEAELRLMKHDAYLINIGRGGTIDETALARALREGWIGGAGLDVFEHEPLPAESPLWGLENMIITPHYAGSSPHYDERAMAIFLDNLARYRAGQPLTHVVDKRAGY
jgi:phosphoglycerate dehydrogenase-like enzyme